MIQWKNQKRTSYKNLSWRSWSVHLLHLTYGYHETTPKETIETLNTNPTYPGAPSTTFTQHQPTHVARKDRSRWLICFPPCDPLAAAPVFSDRLNDGTLWRMLTIWDGNPKPKYEHLLKVKSFIARVNSTCLGRMFWTSGCLKKLNVQCFEME